MRQRPGAHVSPRRVRPRYGRIASVLCSAGVTVVAVLGAAGVLPTTSAPPSPLEAAAAAVVPLGEPMRLTGFTEPARTGAPVEGLSVGSDELPEGSGSGRRVVFDMSAQRVWLVDEGDRVRRTYLVSGSLTDNLEPGRYAVYSTSRHAVGVDDSGTMQYMVRFAHGEEAAIGFHDIPVDSGELVQTRAELGTPQSHGCIRQWRPDARALWYFATVGTKVVVTA